MSWSTSRRAALATVRARAWVAASTSCQFQVIAKPLRSRYSMAAAGRRAKMARRSASVGAAISRSVQVAVETAPGIGGEQQPVERVR